MIDQGFWTFQRAAGAFLVSAILPLALGVYLFVSRNGVRSGAPQSQAFFVWERGSILAAVVLTAIGLVLLEAVLQETGGRVLAWVGASVYFFGAVLLVAAEAMRLPKGQASYPLIVIYLDNVRFQGLRAFCSQDLRERVRLSRCLTTNSAACKGVN